MSFENTNKNEVIASYPTEEAVRQLLIEEGVIGQEEIMMPEDFEATVRRAKILMREDPSLTEEAAITLGYADRMSFITHSMVGVIERMDPELLLSMIKEAGHREANIEDIALLVRFIKERPEIALSESIIEWSKARSHAQETVDADLQAVVDGRENVIGVSNNPSDLRKSIEQGRGLQ
jgi:hypothetical protein